MPIKTHLDDPPSLNLTSMMDVVFLLLIFFLTATEFSQDDAERSIDLQVPLVSNAGALTAAPSKREVNVFRDGRLTLDSEDVTLEELTNRLAAAHRGYPDLGVIVRGDGDGRFQRVAEVLNACKQAGIGELAISVRLSQSE
ncbi:MAG: ExbD/TolR family protein [Pirellulales bacterium]